MAGFATQPVVGVVIEYPERIASSINLQTKIDIFWKKGVRGMILIERFEALPECLDDTTPSLRDCRRRAPPFVEDKRRPAPSDIPIAGGLE